MRGLKLVLDPVMLQCVSRRGVRDELYRRKAAPGLRFCTRLLERDGIKNISTLTFASCRLPTD